MKKKYNQFGMELEPALDRYLLNRYIAFLEYMNVDLKRDKLLLDSGGNSVVCNNDTEWKECLGKSINEVTRIVAQELGKEVEWEKDEW